MSCIIVSDSDASSDEEIKFTSVPKVKTDSDSDVVFCGVRSSLDSASCKKLLSKFPINRDEITIKTTTVAKRTIVTPPEDDGSDVEFIGEVESQTISKVVKPSSASRPPVARGRSDSVNININSKESMNTNVTINIEDDAKSNQKKVKLTFLGPGNRGRRDPVNSNTPRRVNNFKPVSSSTPCAPKKIIQSRESLNLIANTNQIKKKFDPVTIIHSFNKQKSVTSGSDSKKVNKVTFDFKNCQNFSGPPANRVTSNSKQGIIKNVSGPNVHTSSVSELPNPLYNMKKSDKSGKKDDWLDILRAQALNISQNEKVLGKHVKNNSNSSKSVKNNDKSKGSDKHLVSSKSGGSNCKETSPIALTSKNRSVREESPSVLKESRKRNRSRSPSLHKNSRTTKSSPIRSKSKGINTKVRSPTPSKSKCSKSRDESPIPSTSKESKSRDRSPIPSTSKGSKSKDRSPIPSTSKGSKSRDRSPIPSTSKESKSRDRSPIPSTSKGSKSRDRSPMPSTSKENQIRDRSPVPSTSRGGKSRDRSPIPSTSKERKSRDRSERINYRDGSCTSSSSERSESRDRSPLPSTSNKYKNNSIISATPKCNKKSDMQEDSCSDSESDKSYQSREDYSSSCSEDSSSESIEPAMTKQRLDNLLNKFLNICLNVSSKPDVVKFKKKLMKQYLSDVTSALDNHDFILSLKETTGKMERKPVRCPIENMKKVLSELRRNSPGNEKKIKRLESLLKEINKKIKVLEEAEVSSDEEECNNNYLRLDRYRKRAVQIYKKICELYSVPADADRAVLRNVSFQGTAPDIFSKSISVQNLVNKVSHALEKYYNKSRKFPDFNDVIILMKKLALEGSYKLKPETIHQLGKSIFTEFGNMLQRRRLHDDYSICNEYLEDDDPALNDPVLTAKLDANKKYWRKEQEVLNEFCLKQVALKEGGVSLDEGSHTESSDDSHEDECRKRSSMSRDNSCGSSVSDNNEGIDHFQSKVVINSDNSSEEDECNEKTKKKKRRRSSCEEEVTSEKSKDDVIPVSSNKSDRDNDDAKRTTKKRRHSTQSQSSDVSVEDLEKLKGCSVEDTVDSSICRGDTTINYENGSTICADDSVSRCVVTETHEVDTNNKDIQEKDIECIAIDDESNDCNTSILNATVKSSVTSEEKLNDDIVTVSETSEATQGFIANSESSICVITNVISCANAEYDKAEKSTADEIAKKLMEEPPISLVSDDEEGTDGNILSQEDVMEIIPVIMGSQ